MTEDSINLDGYTCIQCSGVIKDGECACASDHVRGVYKPVYGCKVCGNVDAEVRQGECRECFVFRMRTEGYSA